MVENKRFKRPKLPAISSTCSILLGGVIGMISTASFIIDIISTQNPIAIGIDLIIMMISYLTVWQGLYFSIATRIANDRMQEQWEYRIRPFINMLTDTAGKIEELEREMAETNMQVKTTMDYVVKSRDIDTSKAYILPGVSFKFIAKILVLIMFTFSSLVYISSYPLGIVHYFIMLIYLVWWLSITAEYKLFGRTIAWIWGIAPVLVIPSIGIILSAIYGLNIMIGILFVALLVYVYAYFTWASISTTGFNLIDLKPVIYQIRKRFKKNQRPEINTEELREMLK